jgi:dienelactone hydrolase
MEPTATRDPFDDPLNDFTRRSITLDAVTRTVYVSGNGPAVIVMAEMPGISPDVARFARWVREAGFTVYMPSLFGRDGAYPHADDGVAVFKRACVSAEFRTLAANESSPVTTWLRGLARLAHHECGGPGVGAVGMCFTGNFALTMMLEPSMLAPVLCQPSLPLDAPGALEISAAELVSIRERLNSENLTVRGYRFEGDRFCTRQRFDAYAAALGNRFQPQVLPAAAANPTPPPFFEQVVGCAHSVVTAHLIDADGEPTAQARDSIIDFFVERLTGEKRQLANQQDG